MGKDHPKREFGYSCGIPPWHIDHRDAFFRGKFNIGVDRPSSSHPDQFQSWSRFYDASGYRRKVGDDDIYIGRLPNNLVHIADSLMNLLYVVK